MLGKARASKSARISENTNASKNNRYLTRFLRSITDSFGFAQFLVSLSLILIIGSSLILSIFISNTTRVSLVNSQKVYALLIAENMNSQIFRRFSLPVAVATGRVALGDPDQFQILDEVVNSLMQGFPITDMRIYDSNYAVTYSTISEDIERTDLYSEGVPLIFEGSKFSFEIISNISYAKAMFVTGLPKESFVLRVVYPLTVDKTLPPFETEEYAVLGALELMIDITDHYTIAIRSQWLILIAFTLSALIIFFIFQIVYRKAERIIKERVDQNKKLEMELHQSEKLASMGSMVASIAHEIHNPLGIIQSSSEYLLTRPNTDQTSEPILQAIYDESFRLGKTVNDFLDYAKPRKPVSSVVDLKQVVTKLSLFLSSSFSAKETLLDINIENPLLIAGDEDLIYRALYNVVINAQEAIGEKGIIFIEGKYEDIETVSISVEDSGSGFEEDKIEKYEDPFFTTKDTGTGLGLAIVKSIITNHGGRIILSNARQEKGGGAKVTIYFNAII